MGRIRTVLWYVLLTICFATCSPYASHLSQAERLLEIDPAAADSVLSSITVPRSSRDLALYAVLKTQADYKLYRDIPHDSIIRIATNYYGRKVKDYHAALAWYSLGCVSYELCQDSTAADAYLTAIRLFPDTLVRYYALAEQNLSHIYLDHKMDVEAIPMIKACRSNAVRLNDSAAIAFCDYNIANSHLYNFDYEVARNMFLELKENRWLSPNTKDVPLLQLSKISLYNDHEYEEAIRYVDTFLKTNNHINPYGTAYSLKADAYRRLNQLDSALIYYNLSLTDTKDPYTICNTYRYLAEIQSIKGNQDSVSFCTRQVSKWADSIVTVSNSENIFRALLNNSQSEKAPQSRWHNLYRTTLYFMLLTIVFCLLFFWKRRTRAANIEESINQAINNTDNSDEEIVKDPLIEAIEESTNEFVVFKLSELFIKMISATTGQTQLSGKEKGEFIKEFRNSFLRLRAKMAASYNVNDDEIDFCIYTLLGFRQKDFNTLFYIEHHRMIKYRLKEKLPIALFDYIFKSNKSVSN